MFRSAHAHTHYICIVYTLILLCFFPLSLSHSNLWMSFWFSFSHKFTTKRYWLFTRVYTIICNDCPHSIKCSLAAHFMNLCYVTFFWLACLLTVLAYFRYYCCCCYCWFFISFFSLSFFLFVVVTLFRSISFHLSIVCVNRRALSTLSKMPWEHCHCHCLLTMNLWYIKRRRFAENRR